MPGIVGYCGFFDNSDDMHLLPRMAHALEPDDRFRLELFEESLLGIGRVTLGIANPELQPIWNEDETLCVMMEGELYDYQAIRQDLIKKDHHFRVNNDAELLLHLYEENGDDFAKELNGAFIATIWDRQSQRLLIVNDRLGLYPLYYTFFNGHLFFASGVRALLVNQSVPRKIDPIAIAEFLTFDHVLGDRTFLEYVRLLPQASILIFKDQQLEIHPYWKLSYPSHYPLVNEKEYMDRFLELLEQAVIRQAIHNDQSAGILLSGGLDSRILLAILNENTRKRPFYSFSWGIPGCDDARFARNASKIVGADHHFFELKPDWLLEKASEAVRITDGMGNLVNLHAIATLEEEARYVNVLYKGFLGDAMMGFGITHHLWANCDGKNAINTHLESHRALGLITFDLDEHKKLFNDAFINAMSTGLIEEYFTSMKASGSDSLADQRNYFDFSQRIPRMTIKGVEVARDRTIVRLPFCDNDLVEFSLSVPPGLRYKRRLAKNAFIREFPKLAQVPITETGFPMMFCARDIYVRLKKLVIGQLGSVGFGMILPKAKRPYKNYNLWFRTTLREWMENNLLDKQSLDRGYFKPNFIREVISEHLAGKNNAVKLGALLSLEIWHKNFID